MDGRGNGERSNIGGGEVEPGIGIAPDYINAWMGLGMAARMAEAGDKVNLELYLRRPILKYKDYLTSKYPADADRVFGGSNPAKIALVDALVDEYNAAMEGIKSTRDLVAMVEFWKRADKLIRTKG